MNVAALKLAESAGEGFLKKLGWFRVGDLRILIKPIFPIISYNKRPAAEFKIEEIKEFPEDVASLWARLKSKLTIGIIRTKQYLDWRYLQCPDKGYRAFTVNRNGALVGYFVLKITKYTMKLFHKKNILPKINLVNTLFVIKASLYLDQHLK